MSSDSDQSYDERNSFCELCDNPKELTCEQCQENICFDCMRECPKCYSVMCLSCYDTLSHICNYNFNKSLPDSSYY